MRKTLRNPVLGENLEDLHLELEYQRSARQPKLLNSVRGENLEDDAHHHAELECHRSVRQKPGSVGTSTNCSARCGSRKYRVGTSSRMILGTSITCSATGKSASKNWSTSTSCSTIRGTGASRIRAMGSASTICSTVRPCTRSCGRGSGSRADADMKLFPKMLLMKGNTVKEMAWVVAFVAIVLVTCSTVCLSTAVNGCNSH